MASYLVHFNKNHDKLGRFSFGDGDGDGKGNDHGRRDGEGSTSGSSDPKSPDSYRTPELDKKYSELEKTGLFKLQDTFPWLKPGDDAEKLWGKDIAKAVDIGIEAMEAKKLFGDSANVDDNLVRSFFFLDDMAPGFAEIAYLASKGWSGDKIFEAIKDTGDMWTKNAEFTNTYTGYPQNKNWSKKSSEAYEKQPYKGIYDLSNLSATVKNGNDEIDSYIARCVELAKDMEHSDSSDYLEHYNKNHDKLGRFAIGDGDGDGIRDDHANQNKESVGDKVKKAVATYDNVKNSYRQRAMAEENYKLAKEKAGLQRDQIENLRNIEQNSVKSRDLDVAAQRQQARVDAQAARTQAFIDKYRAKTEVTLAKAEQAEARARALAAKAEMKAIRNADRLERQAARRERAAERRAERQAIQAEKRAARQEERMAARAVRARERIHTNQIADRNALVKKYNSSANRKRIGAFIAVAASPIPFAAAITLPVAAGLGISASKDAKAAKEIEKNYHAMPY